MTKAEIFKRYLIFTIGLFVTSLGVAIVTKANLGTSPISSIPYVLSIHFPLTMGQFTILLNAVLIVLQLIILRADFKAEAVLQIPVSFAFGYFIDFSMFLLHAVSPEMYIAKVLWLLAGCIVLGLGVYMEILADVVMLSGEAFINAVVFKTGKEFGVLKIVFDVSMTVIAAVLSVVFMGRLSGIGAGTVIAAVLVGSTARFIGKQLSFLPEKLFEVAAADEDELCEEIMEIPAGMEE